MNAFIFKITPANQKDIFRKIQIPGNLTFEDLHFAILDSFDLTSGEMASFFKSDESYYKGEEILLEDMDNESDDVVLMEDLTVEDAVKSKTKHFLYHYDYLFLKAFHVEFIEKVKVEEEDAEDVLLLESEGKYIEDLDQMSDFLLDDEDLDSSIIKGGGKAKKDKVTYKKANPLSIDDELEFLNLKDDEDDDDEYKFENIDDLDL